MKPVITFVYLIALIGGVLSFPSAKASVPMESVEELKQASILFKQIEMEVLQQLPLSNKPISTVVGGFRLSGNRSIYQVSITDLDILISEKEQRLLPLLRLLKRLHANVTFENGQLIYAFQAGENAIVDFQRSTLKIKEITYPIKLIKGVSDITGKQEIYISEQLFSAALGLHYFWDDTEYSVVVTTEGELNIFQEILARRTQHIEFDLSELTENLPETEGIKNSSDFQQLITFSELSLDIKNIIKEDQNFKFFTPKLTLYGHLLGGEYRMSFSESLNTEQSKTPDFPLWLQEVVWQSDIESFVVEAGDTGIGLTPLSIPFASFTGVSFRGLTEDSFSPLGKKTFLEGNNFSFANEQKIDGVAPIGSTVEIFINGRLSYSELIKTKDGSAIGNGRYELLMSSGLNQTLNEVKTVVTELDGTKTEKVEFISNNISLLKQGQWAYSGGAGTRRRKQEGKLITQGFLAGAGLFYGINNAMTLGFSFASQNDFYRDINSLEESLDSRLYLGEHFSVKLSERLFLTQNIGLNGVIDEDDVVVDNTNQQTNKYPIALENTLEYKASSSLFALYHFDYEKDYSAGDINLGNRKGWGGFIQSKIEGHSIFNSVYANINSHDTDDNTQYFAAEWKNQNLIPKSSLSIRADWIKQQETVATNGNERKLYSLNIISNLTRNIEIELNRSWGKPIEFADNKDLRSGVPVPMITTSLPFGTRVSGKYRFSDSWSTYANYIDSGIGHKSAELSIERNLNFPGEMKFKLLSRHDLINSNQRTIVTFEYPFNRGGGDLFGLSYAKGNNGDSYNINLYLTISGLFTWDKFTPHYIKRTSQIRPESGGIQGRVYLDSNTNGKYDEGEIGMENIDVLLNGRNHYRSGTGGWFYIPRNERQHEIVVSLEPSSLPATYTPTQGVQVANWDKTTLTRVNLGIAALTSLSGKIIFGDVSSRALPGVIVKLIDLDNEKEERQSFSDSYGEYYFGEIKMGRYEIQIITDSLPANTEQVNQLPEFIINAETATDEIVMPTINISRIYFR
jgi:hypothetical protein